MSSTSCPDWVPESSFGKWFLNTETWVTRVIQVAINDLRTCMDDPNRPVSTVLDVGVGFGKSLWILDQSFGPNRIIGIDVDREVLERAEEEARHCHASIELMQCNAAQITLPDNSIDMLFCHQTFHHIVDQESAIGEFYRVLKPGGRLLFAESTRKYIHSWIIKWLFRHPMDVQKTAEQYLQLIRSTGFSCRDRNISYPYLWWSRSDLGIMERWFKRPIPRNKEETLINLVASKPMR
jgi:ubiquinone/menaquinone biosynthesis C-methylase UbiE